MDPIASQHDRPRPGRIRTLVVGLAAASLVVGCNGAVASPAPTTMASSSASAVSPSFAGPGGSILAPGPSPITSPSLSVEPSASYPPGVIFEGAAFGGNVAWSPKGTRVAVLSEASGAAPRASIIDLTGRVEDDFEAFDFAWLDEDTYIATKGINDPYGADAFATFTGSVGSAARPSIPGNYWQIVAGPAGVVALKLNETGSDRYVIWSRSGVSSPRDGVPVAFSPDGSLLGVVHYPRACCAGLPSPEPTKAPGPTTLDIVRTDTGKSVRVTGDVMWGYGLPVVFSPDGRTVAYRLDYATGPEEVGILDIATGRVWALPGQADTSPDEVLAWTDSTHLAVGSSNSVHTTPAGLKVTIKYWPADVTAMAVSSRGDVATTRKGSKEIVVDRGGQQRSLDLPGTFAAVGLTWSPDGSTLMAVCSSFDGGVPGQVVVLRP